MPPPPTTGSNGASELEPAATPGYVAQAPLAGGEPAMGGPAAGRNAEEPHKTPWGWIAACGVLVVAVVVLALWGFGKQADLTDQKDATARAQEQAAQASREADQANQQVDELSSQFDQLSQNVSDAGAAAKESFQAALGGLENSLASLKGELSQIEPPAAAAPTPASTATAAATSTAVENATPDGQ